MSKLKRGFVANLRYLSLAGIFTLGMLTIIATGGGGGGGGSGGIVYTGLTSQATLGDGNAEALSTGAYLGGSVASVMGSVAVVRPSEIGRPRTLTASRALEDAIRLIDPSSTSAGASFGATGSGSLPGNCGGEAFYNITYDDVSGAFSGTINFVGYCEYGVTLNGFAPFSGTLDPGTGQFKEFTISFTLVNVIEGSDSFAMQGSISYTFQPASVDVNMEMLLRDNSTMAVFWINNYNMTLPVQPGYVEFTISGRFYDPAYGYVDVSTPTPFCINHGELYPFQGVLIIAGSGGTKARLTASPPSPAYLYEVECDEDGDDIYEWSSGLQPWV